MRKVVRERENEGRNKEWSDTWNRSMERRGWCVCWRGVIWALLQCLFVFFFSWWCISSSPWQPARSMKKQSGFLLFLARSRPAGLFCLTLAVWVTSPKRFIFVCPTIRCINREWCRFSTLCFMYSCLAYTAQAHIGGGEKKNHPPVNSCLSFRQPTRARQDLATPPRGSHHSDSDPINR